MAHARSESFRQIFKSSALLGGARIFGVITGMVRVKLLAMLLGKVGIGLYGTFESVAMMAITITLMGVNGAGTRQIAQALGSGNMEEVGRAIKTLRYILNALGVVGTIAMVALAWPISFVTFHTGDYRWEIILLAVGIPLVMNAYGKMAIIQGLGRMGDIARINVWCGIVASALAVIFILAFRARGIAPALLAGYFGYYVAAWWYWRKIEIPQSSITWRDAVRGSGIYFKLGVALMTASLLSTLVLYIARATIAQRMGLGAVGIYVCAFSLSGKFVSLIVDPMWADFFPRASSLAHDDAGFNKVINEQTEIVLLLAAPGVLATLIFAPLLVRIFYSGEFTEAPLLMRWFTMGCFFGLVEMPVRVVQLAKGKSFLCLATETIGGGLHVLLILGLLRVWNLKGCAIAYVVHVVLQLMVSYYIAHRLSGFKWTLRCQKMIVVFTILISGAFVASWFLSGIPMMSLGAIAVAGVVLFSVRQLTGRLGADHRVSLMLARFPIIGPMVIRP